FHDRAQYPQPGIRPRAALPDPPGQAWRGDGSGGSRRRFYRPRCAAHRGRVRDALRRYDSVPGRARGYAAAHRARKIHLRRSAARQRGFMKQVLQNYKTGELRLADVPRPALRAGGILVATRASLISAGTEKMKLDVARKNLIGKALERPDQVRKVIE